MDIEPVGAVATGSVGMSGRLFIYVIRYRPSRRQRVVDTIANFLRRHAPC